MFWLQIRMILSGLGAWYIPGDGTQNVLYFETRNTFCLYIAKPCRYPNSRVEHFYSFRSRTLSSDIAIAQVSDLVLGDVSYYEYLHTTITGSRP
jgi:hypothetical protein